MQIRIISVPVQGGEAVNEELNTVLRSKKVLQVEQRFVDNPQQGAMWSFCIKYVEDYSPFGKKDKVDYRQVLDEESFKRFSAMREIRRRLSKEEDIPAFSIFTDEELAELAKMEELTIPAMKKVKGVGEKKAEKYGPHFITSKKEENEAGE